MDKLDIHVEEKWLQSVNSKPKLRTYKLYKSKLVPEDYVLRLTSGYHWSTFAKFRCGILPLNVEVGQYRGVKLENPICPLCKNGVETEIHFLLEYTEYGRGTFLPDTKIDSTAMPNAEKLKILMDNHQKATSIFVCNLWNQRQAKLIV